MNYDKRKPTETKKIIFLMLEIIVIHADKDGAREYFSVILCGESVGQLGIN